MSDARVQRIAARRDFGLEERRSREPYREYFDEIGVGISEADLATGRLLNVNPAFCEIIGYGTAELLGGITFAELTHPDDRPMNREEHEKLLRGEVRSYTIEKRYIRKDGTIIWGRVCAALTRHQDGSPKSTLAVIEDVTEQKRTEARLQLALAVGQVATWDWDLLTDNATCSASWRRLYGLHLQTPAEPGAQVSYADWLQCLHPDDRSQAVKAIERAKAVGSYADEFRVVWPDGSVRWLAARGRIERDAAGAAMRFIGCNIDITSQMKGQAGSVDRRHPASFHRHEYADGSMIFWEGDPAEHFFLVTSGAVKIYRTLPDGRSQILGFRHVGDLLGFSEEERYTYCAEAMGDVAVRRFSARELDILRPPFRSLHHRLMSQTMHSLVEAHEHVTMLGTASAREKIVRFLLALWARRDGGNAASDSMKLPMSRQEIADYLALRRETVSRVLGELRNEGLIEPSKRTIRIPDAGRLEAEIETGAATPGRERADPYGLRRP